MGHCKYCGQSDTKLDNHGYCVKYQCYERSGDREKYERELERLKSLAWKYLDIPKHACGQIGTVVSNPYNKRTKYCNDVMYEAKKVFGYVPKEILKIIPKVNQKQWDKNIRW